MNDWIQTRIPPWLQGIIKQGFQTPRRQISLLHNSSGQFSSGQIYEGGNGPVPVITLKKRDSQQSNQDKTTKRTEINYTENNSPTNIEGASPSSAAKAKPPKNAPVNLPGAGGTQVANLHMPQPVGKNGHNSEEATGTGEG